MTALPSRMIVVSCSLALLAVSCGSGIGRSGPTVSALPTLQPIATLECPEGSLSLRPVDLGTLEDVPTVHPLPIGEWAWFAASPNGRWLAVGNPDSQCLRLVDLERWVVTKTGFPGGYTFSVDDSGNVFWVEGGANARLIRYPQGSTEAEVIALLPRGFVRGEEGEPWLSPDGSKYAVVGVPEEAGVARGPGELVIVDLLSGQVTEVPIPDLKLGVVGDEGTGLELGLQRHVAAVIWDTPNALLYVVHADEDRVTVADLDQGVLQAQALIGQADSFWGRLLAFWIPPAQAKALSGDTRRGVLSPDGSQLYVASLRAEAGQDASGWFEAETPIGLSVIDTGTLQLVAPLELPVDTVAASPDGRVLLATGLAYRSHQTEEYVEEPSGLFIIEASSLQVIRHLELDERIWNLGFSPDGRFGYLSSWTDAGTTLRAVDLSTLEIRAEREGRSLILLPELGLLAEVP